MITDNYANVPLSLRRHEHVAVITPALKTIWVDKGIARILSALWASGIETIYSCEGDVSERGYIYFASSDDLDAFRRRMVGSTAEYLTDSAEPIIRFNPTALKSMTRHLF